MRSISQNVGSRSEADWYQRARVYSLANMCNVCLCWHWLIDIFICWLVRSPVFAHFATSLNGLTTIRTYRLSHQFVAQFETIQDRHAATYLLSLAAARWIGVMLDWLANLYFLAVVLIFYALPPSQSPFFPYLKVLFLLALQRSGHM